MTIIFLHTWRHNGQLKVCYALGFMYKLILFFRILSSWKARFSIAPFRPRGYVLLRLRCLEVSNGVRKWNKVKNSFRGVETWIMPIGITNIYIYIQENESEIIYRLVSFLFCEFNRVTSWNVGKNIVSTFNISKSQIEILVSFSRSTNLNENMFFPNSNFEGNVSTYVCGMSFWYYRELKIECFTSRHTLCEKILKTFVSLEIRILVKNWNVYEGHIFPRA